MNATGKLMAVGWDGRMDLQVAQHAGWHTHTPPPPGDRPLMRDTVVLTTLEVKMHDVRVVLASTSYTAPPKKLACAVQAAADHSKSSPHDCGRRANTLHHEDACGTLAWRRQRRCGEGGGWRRRRGGVGKEARESLQAAPPYRVAGEVGGRDDELPVRAQGQRSQSDFTVNLRMKHPHCTGTGVRSGIPEAPPARPRSHATQDMVVAQRWHHLSSPRHHMCPQSCW